MRLLLGDNKSDFGLALYLDDVRVEAETWSKLREVPVKKLVLTDVVLSDENLLHAFINLPDLEVLEVVNVDVSRSDLSGILSLKKLRDLSLIHTNIKAGEVGKLSMLKQLVDLSLRGNRLNATELSPLFSLKHIKWIDLRETTVKRTDVSHLIANLPSDCEVAFDD